MKCCDVTPAQLNRSIEIQKLVVVATDTGGFTNTWVKVYATWAKIKNTSGTELIHADQLGSVSFSDFTIRYRAGLVESMRIVYRGVNYQVRHINNLEESDKWLVIKGERGVSQ